MALKLNTGLAASILVGSGLTSLALSAQPAHSIQVCVGNESFSLESQPFPDNFDTPAGARFVLAGALLWVDDESKATDLSKKYFQNEAAFIWYAYIRQDPVYFGRNNGRDVNSYSGGINPDSDL